MEQDVLPERALDPMWTAPPKRACWRNPRQVDRERRGKAVVDPTASSWQIYLAVCSLPASASLHL